MEKLKPMEFFLAEDMKVTLYVFKLPQTIPTLCTFVVWLEDGKEENRLYPHAFPQEKQPTVEQWQRCAKLMQKFYAVKHLPRPFMPVLDDVGNPVYPWAEKDNAPV